MTLPHVTGGGIQIAVRHVFEPRLAALMFRERVPHSRPGTRSGSGMID
jgi:hypothetical protein